MKASFSCAFLGVCVLAQTSGAGKPRSAAGDEPGLLLKPTRNLHFTVTEGTWMSADVSPDGRTVIFDLLGQLYIIPNIGGTARQITIGMSWNGQPRFSRDGSRIVFTSDRSGDSNLWTARPDGTEMRQLTHSSWNAGTYLSPCWSPDGSIVVATKVSGNRTYSPIDLVAISVGSGEETKISNSQSGQSNYLGATFGPSSQFIYATRCRGVGLGEKTACGVVRIDLETPYRRRRETLETSRWSLQSSFRPLLSPDGRLLAYAQEQDGHTAIRLRDLTTGHERTLLGKAQRHASIALQTRDLMPGMAFTPDSLWLVLSYGGKLHQVEIKSGRDLLIPFTAKVQQPMGPLVRNEFSIDDNFVKIRGIQHPEFSPDGARLAFSAIDRIWVMDFPNGQPWRLTDQNVGEFNPTWSPDGRSIVYTTWNDRDGGAVWRAPLIASNEPERLTNTPERVTAEKTRYEFVRFSPDGRSLWATRIVAEASSLLYRVFDWEDTRGAIPKRTLIRISLSDKSETDFADLGSSLAGGESGFSLAGAEPYPESDGFVSAYTLDLGLVKIAEQGGALDKVLQVYGPTERGSGVQYGNDGHRGREAINVVPSPDRKMLIARISGGRLYLIKLPPTLSERSVIGIFDTPPAGVTVTLIGSTGGDFIAWAPDGSYFYYSAGNIVVKQRVNAEGHLLDPERFQIDLQLPADKPSGTVALRGARIITMRGNEVIDNGDIVIRGNRILSIGRSGSVPIPTDAEVRDVFGKTIIPGYIDVHDHIRVGGPIHPTQFPYLLGQLAYGVTTSRDPLGYQDLPSYSERIATGQMVGPRVFGTNEAIYEENIAGIDTFDHMRDFFSRWAQDYHSETMKIVFAGGRRTRQLVAMAALANGMYPTNHIEGDANMLTIPIDGYGALEHTLEDMPIYRDVVQLFAQSKVVWTPTIGIQYGFHYFMRKSDLSTDAKFRRFTTPYQQVTPCCQDYSGDDSYLHELLAVPAAVVAAGGKVGLGAHGNITGLGDHWDLWLYAMGGMPNHDVLRAATIFGAEGIGHAKDLGSLEVGKLADLQVLDKNPLDDIHNTLSIRYVMKNGRLYDASDLTEVWPRHRGLDRLSWWETGRKSEQ